MEAKSLRKCIIPECSSTENSSFLFHFPVENETQLNEWMRQMPTLDFSSINLHESFVCENHFNVDQIKVKSEKQLTLGAIPSLFQVPDPDFVLCNPSVCRLCLKSLDCISSSITLDSTIRKHFKNLTNFELKNNHNLPDRVCVMCYNETIKSSTFKTNILEAQRKLEEVDIKDHDLTEFKIKEEQEESVDYINEENFENLEVTLQENEMERINDHDDHDDDEDDDHDDHDDGDDEHPKSYKRKMKHHYSSDDDDGEEDKTTKVKRKRDSLKRKYEHAKEKVLCSDCGQYFARANIKKHHLRIHLRAPPQFKCDICEKMFFRKDELKNHMKVHSGPRDKLHHCELCDKKFATKGSLKIHFNIVHLKIGNICCEFCGKSFMNNTNYQNHLRSTHTLERPFRCDEEGCSSAYFSKGDLVDHKNRCHSNETAVCPICAKVFSSKVALRNHDKRIHAEHSFICPFESCDKKFITNSLLLKHQKVHLGQKDHECSLCGMRYYRNTDLKRHILSIHMKVKIACEVPGCKSQFARKETYRNHVLSHHKEIGEENIQIILLKIRSMQLPAPELDESVVM